MVIAEAVLWKYFHAEKEYSWAVLQPHIHPNAVFYAEICMLVTAC